MSIEHESFWAGAFGSEYTARNRVDFTERAPFWHGIIDRFKPASILEVGCNAGWNMDAIKLIDDDIIVHGVDVNHDALTEARSKGHTVYGLPAQHIDQLPRQYDLVFTAGVLIHVPPSDLRKVMRRIVEQSTRFVVSVEYGSNDVEEVNYRGHGDRLWKRPYGLLYAEMGLRALEAGEAEGFDRCGYWVFEK